MFSLEDKQAVITGGGSGIGKGIAETFAKQGAVVHIIELNEANAIETVTAIETAGGKAFLHVCDVSDQLGVKKVFESIGGLDILVNSAGIAHIGKADTTSQEDFTNILM